MKPKVVLFAYLALIFLLGISPVYGQKKLTTPKKITVVETVSDSIPEIKDFAFVVEIDKNSNVALKAQKTEDSDVLTNASDVKTLKAIFSGATAPKSPLAPILIVKADPSSNYSDVLNVINAFRVSPMQKTKVEISKDFYAFVPPKPVKNSPMKPNPLTLVVKLDEKMNLTLNNEEKGSLNDISLLINSLKQIFKDRAQNGVIREGTNELETTVFIKAPPTVKFAEVIKIAENLKEAGSRLIGLLIEDPFPQTLQESIINIPDVRQP